MKHLLLTSFLLLQGSFAVIAQEDSPGDTVEVPAAEETPTIGGQVTDMTESLDQNQRIRNASTRLLQPIYDASKFTTSQRFYWIAFALTSAGVISYSLQLVLSKLLLLTKGSINLREILSDGVGFAVSAIGLILVTQAATDHESFADSPTSVLSAASVGILAGLILYRWNQREEVNALRGRRKKKRGKKLGK